MTRCGVARGLSRSAGNSKAEIAGPDGLRNFIVAAEVGDTDGDGFNDVVIAHGVEIHLHRGSASGLRPGVLVHQREHSQDDIKVGGAAQAWWWIDSDAGRAFRVPFGRRPRPREIPLP